MSEIKVPSNRSFGFVMVVVFLFIGLLPLISGGHAVYVWALALSGLLVFVAVAAPKLLAPFNYIWMRFGSLMHRIVSPMVLGVIFFLVVTPTGMLRRFLGKDSLRRGFDSAIDTYWIEKQREPNEENSMRNQF